MTEIDVHRHDGKKRRIRRGESITIERHQNITLWLPFVQVRSWNKIQNIGVWVRYTTRFQPQAKDKSRFNELVYVKCHKPKQ